MQDEEEDGAKTPPSYHDAVDEFEEEQSAEEAAAEAAARAIEAETNPDFEALKQARLEAEEALQVERRGGDPDKIKAARKLLNDSQANEKLAYHLAISRKVWPKVCNHLYTRN